MSNPLLSSEQALDDYFNALLDEELGDEDLLPEPEPEPERAPELKPAPQMAAVAQQNFFEQELDEIELPNLDDVQRLLSQLENSNPVAELDLEQVMEQNTLDIAVHEVVATPSGVDEIQEWEPEPELHREAEQPDSLVLQDVQDLAEPEISVTEPIEEVAQPQAEVIADSTSEPVTQAGGGRLGHWDSPVRNENFQVLYFDVNGVTFAVPLDELGGIHQKGSLNHLIGRPVWYLGLQTNRDTQLDVVDTAKWVMAEKLRDDSHKEHYQYIVMLGESHWGLACTKLLGTELLNSDKVRWREQVGKRPWLAGMVKEKMCALIHVEALIAMLNAGLDVKALDK